MKVWSDFSTFVKLAAICLVIGFALGLCAVKMPWASADLPLSPPASSSPTTTADPE